MDEAATTGTFLVTHADEGGVVLRDVTTGQVHTLADNPDPDLDVNEVLEATIAPEPPLEVTWRIVEIESRRTIELVDSDLEPTRNERELADDQPIGEVIREERAGEGELHVLSLPEGDERDAADEILADAATLSRAARLGVARVEVRTGEGLVCVRYLPD